MSISVDQLFSFFKLAFTFLLSSALIDLKSWAETREILAWEEVALDALGPLLNIFILSLKESWAPSYKSREN